jgi:hypothetical protein
MYKTSFFIIKGSTLLASCLFCPVDKDFSIYPIYKNILTSFNHYSFVKNKLAYVVYYGTPKSSMTLGNVDKTFATTWLLFGL